MPRTRTRSVRLCAGALYRRLVDAWPPLSIQGATDRVTVNAIAGGERVHPVVPGRALLTQASDVVCREPRGRVPVAESLTPLRDHIARVVPIEAEAKMSRVDAAPVVARMHYDRAPRPSYGDRAAMPFVGEPMSMGSNHLAVDRHGVRKVAVPAGGESSRPRPILVVRATINESPESLHQRETAVVATYESVRLTGDLSRRHLRHGSDPRGLPASASALTRRHLEVCHAA